MKKHHWVTGVDSAHITWNGWGWCTTCGSLMPEADKDKPCPMKTDATKPATRPADTTDGGRVCPWSVKRGDRMCVRQRQDEIIEDYEKERERLAKRVDAVQRYELYLAFVAAFDAWRDAVANSPFTHEAVAPMHHAMIRAREELDG